MMKKTNSHTVAIIKPNVMDHLKEIETLISNKGYKFCSSVEKTWPKAIWEEFYSEHKGKPFFDPLVNFMSSGPCKAYLLSHEKSEDAIQEWRKTIGNTDPKKAKEEDPNSLRALYGNPLLIRENGFHGSDTIEAVHRESALLFFRDLN